VISPQELGGCFSIHAGNARIHFDDKNNPYGEELNVATLLAIDPVRRDIDQMHLPTVRGRFHEVCNDMLIDMHGPTANGWHLQPVMFGPFIGDVAIIGPFLADLLGQDKSIANHNNRGEGSNVSVAATVENNGRLRITIEPKDPDSLVWTVPENRQRLTKLQTTLRYVLSEIESSNHSIEDIYANEKNNQRQGVQVQFDRIKDLGQRIVSKATESGMRTPEFQALFEDKAKESVAVISAIPNHQDF